MAARELLGILEPLAVTGEPRSPVRGLATDSRRVRPGEWFFALAGTRDDGVRFAGSALAAGAGAVVAERPSGLEPEVRVRDVRVSLARASGHFYGEAWRRLFTVGITGTNGKTTASFLTRAVLEAGGRSTGVLGTTGAWLPSGHRDLGFTTPFPVELHGALAALLEEGGQAVVIEASSHGLEQRRVFGIGFDVTVFTNLTHDHLDYHGTLEEYLDAKLRLFDGRNGAAVEKPTVAVIRASDPYADAVRAAAARGGQRIVTYGVGVAADVSAADVRFDARGARFLVRDDAGSHTVTLRLPGEYNVENALAAWAVGAVAGVAPEARARGLAGVRGVPGRLEPVEAGQPFAIYVDFAHTPDALERVLRAVRPLAAGRVHVVFGAGGDRDAAKRPLMGAVAARLADRIVLTSDNPRSEDPARILEAILAGVPAAARAAAIVESDRRAAIQRALAAAAAGDVVVIAGKGHETTQTIGGVSHPFDDREEARAAWERVRRAGGGS
jgi:UDP-N-acetylmuramoyl-L-alanyl-D-glutamate--2,6-diaminopimelate ligase